LGTDAGLTHGLTESAGLSRQHNELRRQSAAASALSSVRGSNKKWKQWACESGVALRLPPQSKIAYFLVMPANKIPWPHAPEHHLSARGTYFVTASTYLQQHHFAGKARLAVLHRGLLKVASKFGWRLEAWAVFSNHYHFIGHSPSAEETAENLSRMTGLLHEKTAKWVNLLDKTPGRKIWHNFRDTRLTYEKSYLARLNYVHQNPVKHHLVPVANLYPWCSARWFERMASAAQIKTIYRFKTNRLAVPDEFEPSPEW
jgi:putative transposase